MNFVIENTNPPVEMAEAQGLAAAESMLDFILEKGAEKIYARYLLPTVMPYAAAQVCAT